MRQTVNSGNPLEEVYGYSRAVRVGDTVHVSGTTARPPHVQGCDAEAQARSALAIIGEALQEVGAAWTDVVRTVTYVTDIADVPLVAAAHREIFADIRPAATLVEVTSLVDPGLKVEIEVYAQMTDG